jgi:hypothetical protein
MVCTFCLCRAKVHEGAVLAPCAMKSPKSVKFVYIWSKLFHMYSLLFDKFVLSLKALPPVGKACKNQL